MSENLSDDNHITNKTDMKANYIYELIKCTMYMYYTY